MPVRALQPTRWLAQRLGLSVSTIERLRARGDRNLPPHVLIGPQTIRYDEAVVEAWLATRMGVSGPPMPVASEVSATPEPSSPVLRTRFGKTRLVSPATGSN